MREPKQLVNEFVEGLLIRNDTCERIIEELSEREDVLAADMFHTIMKHRMVLFKYARNMCKQCKTCFEIKWKTEGRGCNICNMWHCKNCKHKKSECRRTWR